MVISAIEKEKKAMCTKFQKQYAVCDVVFVWFHGEVCGYFIPYA